jgi:hypothetical protein
MLGGLGIGVAIVSNRQNSQEIRTPAEVSPPTSRCSLELNTSETVEPGKYTLNVTVAYTGAQDSVDLTYYWARCRCQEGGGNQTQRGKPICRAYWPDDPGECSSGSQQTVSLAAGSPRSFSQTVSQYDNLDCGAYQIDFVVADVSGEVCNITVPASGFYPTGENCQLPTPSPTPTPPPTPSPTPSPSPAPKKTCRQACGGDNDCEGSLVCDNGKCVNSECRGELDCVCPGQTPSPSPSPAPPKVEKPTKLPPASGGYGLIHALLRTLISSLKSLTPLP